MKYVFLFSIPLLWIFISVTATAYRRSKRGNAENFNVLLNIYKLNPLKHSNVFQAFSNSILLPVQDGRSNALNFNPNESREKENSTNTKLKNREAINYATHKIPDRPLYIEEVTPENFTPGQFLSKLVSMNGFDVDFKENDDKNIDLDFQEKYTRNTDFNDFSGNEDETKMSKDIMVSNKSQTLQYYKSKSKVRIINKIAEVNENSKAANDDLLETVVCK